MTSKLLSGEKLLKFAQLGKKFSLPPNARESRKTSKIMNNLPTRRSLLDWCVAFYSRNFSAWAAFRDYFAFAFPIFLFPQIGKM